MKEYADVLEFLSKQEGGSEYKDVLLAYVKAVQDESKERAARLREASAKLKRLSETAQSEEDNLEIAISTLQRQLKETTTERDGLRTSSEANAKELETLKAEKVQREKETKLRSLADKAGADYDAFKQLLGELPVELVGETVTIKQDDKSLSLDEYLQGQPAWKKAALFSAAKPEEQKQNGNGKLPTAPAQSGQKEPTSVGDSYLAARYSASRFKK